MNNADLVLFLSKKRVSKAEKMQCVKLIVDACLELINKSGMFVEYKNINSNYKEVTHGRICITYSTPFSRIPGIEEGYQLNIWFDSKKVLFVVWDPFEIVSFKKGEWIKELI
jgi:hypothetical protein